MPLDLSALKDAPRLLIEAELKPMQGSRFQPTGFPNLGHAVYDAPGAEKSTRMLLVESAQSMANHLEGYCRTTGQPICWDPVTDDWVEPLKGLPVVKVVDKDDKPLTNSVLEAHRINSEYIARSKGFSPISEEISFKKDRPFNLIKQLVPVLLKYDPNSLIHGIFLEEIGGVIRLPRTLSAFIEAHDIDIAPSGGTKVNRVEPGIKGGEGNVIYSRDEFTGRIVAYFNLDLAQIRAFGLGSNANNLLIAISLFKIQKFFRLGLRLRTACDLELVESTHKATNPKIKPSSFQLPRLEDLEKELPTLIDAVRQEGRFNSNPQAVTIVKHEK